MLSGTARRILERAVSARLRPFPPQRRAVRDTLEASRREPASDLSNMRTRCTAVPWASRSSPYAHLAPWRIILGRTCCAGDQVFIKEPAIRPSLRQDSTYWGLDPADVVTAWVAFTDAPVESGAMKFLPGSHKLEQIAHRDTYAADNLLTRGQEIEMAVDEAEAVDVPLKAGEFSLHHIRLVHGSKPNTTPDRRIGLAVRYIPTYVRQVKIDDSAMLVRGEDCHGNFELEPRPCADLDEGGLPPIARWSRYRRVYSARRPEGGGRAAVARVAGCPLHRAASDNGPPTGRTACHAMCGAAYGPSAT